MNDCAFLPGYLFLFLFLGAIFYFSEYLDKRKCPFLGISILFLGAIVVIGKIFLPQNPAPAPAIFGFEWWSFLYQRLNTAILLPGGVVLWLIAGIVLFAPDRKQRGIAFLGLAAAAIWFYLFARSKVHFLDYYLPLILLIALFTAQGLKTVLTNPLTNSTVFDRNISFSIVVTIFFLLLYNNTLSVLLPCKAVYEAEYLYHKVGTAMQDPKSSNGITMLGKREKDAPDYLVFGPYHRFLAGRYRAVFGLSTEDNSIDQPIAIIDVYNKGKTFAFKQIKGTDFDKKLVYQEFPLEFRLKKTAKHVEFRVYFYGLANIRADRIQIGLF